MGFGRIFWLLCGIVAVWLRGGFGFLGCFGVFVAVLGFSDVRRGFFRFWVCALSLGSLVVLGLRDLGFGVLGLLVMVYVLMF